MDSTSGFTTFSNRTGFNYVVDFDYINFNNIPSDVRQIKLFSYIKAIFSALKLFWENTFLPTRLLLMNEISVTPQTIVLEKWLQIKFQNAGIYITNFSYAPYTTYIYNINELGNNGLTNQNYIFNLDETNNGTSGNGIPQTYIYNINEIKLDYNFTVHVPISVINTGYTVTQIEAEVNKYKLIQPTFNVVVF